MFLAFVVMPALKKLDEDTRRTAIVRTAQGFAISGTIALFALVVTGSIMASEMSLFQNQSSAFSTKMVLVALVFVTTVIHIIAGRKRALKVSRAATAATFAATLGVLWFATKI